MIFYSNLRFMDKEIKTDQGTTTTSGNLDFAVQLADWVFQQKSVLKLQNPRHHHVNDTKQHGIYRVKDDLVSLERLTRRSLNSTLSNFKRENGCPRPSKTHNSKSRCWILTSAKTSHLPLPLPRPLTLWPLNFRTVMASSLSRLTMRVWDCPLSHTLKRSKSVHLVTISIPGS